MLERGYRDELLILVAEQRPTFAGAAMASAGCLGGRALARFGGGGVL